MDRNPFEYTRPLEAGQGAARVDLVDRLTLRVRERRLVALVGPRRYGKTTLLAQVAAAAAEVDDLDVVFVDCFGVASVSDFAVRLERAMEALTGPARKAVQRLFARSSLEVSILPGVGFKVSAGTPSAPDPVAVLHHLLDGLSRAAEARGGLVLVLDEFQDVDGVENIDALLRSHLQQARDIAVLFAGSRPSLLRAMFADKAKPFYAQAEVIEVGPLDVESAIDVIEDGFTATGRDAGDAGQFIARQLDGHPQRTMLTAHILWEAVPHSTTASLDAAADALDEAARRTKNEHTALFTNLPRTHRDTLRAIAAHGTPYSASAARALGLKKASAQSAVKALQADGLVERLPGSGWRIVDPLFAAWLRDVGG